MRIRKNRGAKRARGRVRTFESDGDNLVFRESHQTIDVLTSSIRFGGPNIC